MTIFLQIAGGLTLLFLGGEVLVRGAVALAKHLGVPALLIGLTIVAIGTSAPEIVVSIQAALTNHPDIAIGNIIGSNISNILLVMGISALIFPIAIHSNIVKYDAPILLLATATLAVFCFTGEAINMWEGIILLAGLVGYTWFTVKVSHKNIKEDLGEETEELLSCTMSVHRSVLFILAGILLLVYGADILVEGAVSLARIFGLSESVIGLTLIAVGSSAPEIATCAVAAFRKHSDIVAGNIVGSNLLNILIGMSLPAIITDLPVNSNFLNFDLWVILAATLSLLLIMKFAGKINRLAGGLFFIGYIVYISSQFING